MTTQKYCVKPGSSSAVSFVVTVVFSWFSMEQTVDLKAEGLWEELLDDFQPEIFIQDLWVNNPPNLRETFHKYGLTK